MQDIKGSLKLILYLFFLWVLLTLEFSLVNMLIGMMVSLGITLVSYQVIEISNLSIIRAYDLFKFFVRLIYEIYKSSFIHIIRILKKDENPVIIQIELSVKNPYIITMISNAITLTPGTITVDVQGNNLYVLAIKGDDKNHQALKEEIKRKFETPFIKGGVN